MLKIISQFFKFFMKFDIKIFFLNLNGIKKIKSKKWLF